MEFWKVHYQHQFCGCFRWYFFLPDPYQSEAEYPDHALIWNLQLLSELLQGVGAAVLPYADDILACVKRCVHLKSKTGSKYAAEVEREREREREREEREI